MLRTKAKMLIREPLLHFMLLGGCLFVAYDRVHHASDALDPRTIIVNRENMLTFLQYRARAFSSPEFNEAIDALTKNELQKAIEEYVREESLYREAKALQLDRNDYVARLRLIQQLEFITQGVQEKQLKPSPKEVRSYYETHRSQYRMNSRITFTHVFFSSDRHGDARAQKLANQRLLDLNRNRVHFDQAPRYGDRFLYHVNYIMREAEDVASHFGGTMREQLFSMAPDNHKWRGPFKSPYGYHLVLLTMHEAAYFPSLESIRERVEEDARQSLLRERFEESIRSIVSAYKVQLGPIQRNDSAADRDPTS